MKKCKFLTGLIVAYCITTSAFVLSCGKVFSQSAKMYNGKPNLVIIIADDLEYHHLSCYGNIHYKTRDIDSLASVGTRCTDFHTCGALCSLTRASLMSGQYPQRTGITGVPTKLHIILTKHARTVA